MFENKLTIKQLSQSPLRCGSVDILHHLMPTAFAETLQKKGINQKTGIPLRKWNCERSIEVRNMNGIQTAIFLLSSPGIYLGTILEAVSFARHGNNRVYALNLFPAYREESENIEPLPVYGQLMKLKTY